MNGWTAFPGRCEGARCSESWLFHEVLGGLAYNGRLEEWLACLAKVTVASSSLVSRSKLSSSDQVAIRSL